MRFPEIPAAALRDGASVITASARAARALRRLHADAQRKQGLSAWRSPEIADWDSWLERLWLERLRSGREPRLLLSRVQEHEVWVRLVKPSIEGRRLIAVDGVADLAAEAYALLSAYDAREFLRGHMAGVDVESFCEWARGFEDECREREWLSRSMLPLALADALRHPGAGEGPSLPAHVALTGFDRVNPAEQRLIDALKDAGCAVERIEAAPPQTEAGILVEAADARDEITTCAWWARRALEAAGRRNEPIRIAILVPDLASVRGEMERTFRQVLAPQAVPIGARELPLPFEFSLGVSLAEVPAARAALLLLRWMDEALDRDELSWLVLSGFLWRSERDLLPLAEFDARMRRSGVLPAEYPLSVYLRQSGWRGNEAVESMRDRLHTARREWVSNRGELLTFGQWVERAQRILAAAGWPGAHLMETEDFQVLRKWQQLLDGIAPLSFDGRRVSYREFRRVLARQAGETIFSPQSRDAAVEILGPFEAAGMEFDAIWFLGADDARWPAPGRPHPFLTKPIQKQRNMPHADPQADWEIAKLVTGRVLRSAPQCIFSYPMQDSEGERRPSTALDSGIERVSTERMRKRLGVEAADLYHAREFPSPVSADEDAGAGPWPKERDAGGFSTLKMQAECPFRAFATVRLGAQELDRADWGLDPAERGQLLHGVLEGVWGELNDRAALIDARQSGILPGIVSDHVARAIVKYGRGPAARGPENERDQQDQQDKWSNAYLQAEAQRLAALVEEWLEQEARRAPFVVLERERKLSAAVGDLKLKLRADRIDEVEGGRLLIDYKTGKVSADAWEGDRPDEPQLPLYAAFGEVGELRGVLLAQIRSGDSKFAGCIEDSERTLLPGKTRLAPYSEELRQSWARILLALGREFLSGEARVDPKRYPKTCEFCALPGLCRVAESKFERIEDGQSGREDAAGGTDAL